MFAKRNATIAALAWLAAGPLSLDALRADADRVADLLLAGRVVQLPDGRIARS